MKKIITYFMILLISAATLVGCSTPQTTSYEDVSPASAWNMIITMPELIIIDVSPVYDQGHIPGAINYYVGDGTLDDAIEMMDMEETYLVYCHTDEASKLGAQKLIDAGFEMVYRLEGNYSAWLDAGYPFVSTDGYADVSAVLAQEMIEEISDLVIIDVSPLYDQGHIPGAVNYYVGDGTLDNAIGMMDMEKTYLVYCHTDEASMLGAKKLADAGFEKVYRLEGNYGGWLNAGYPYVTAAGYIDISVSLAKAMIDEMPEMIIIDVSPLYDAGHIPGAVNYYVGDGTLDNAIGMLDMDKTYLVYCHTDEASMLGAQKLVDAGFEMVYRLVGNYSAWVDAGYDIEM